MDNRRLIDADRLLEWMEGLRDQYEFSPMAHEAGRHWILNIAIRKVKDGAFAPDPIPPTIKPGDKVRLPSGDNDTIIDIQYAHDRYQTRNISGWMYGIKALEVSHD